MAESLDEEIDNSAELSFVPIEPLPIDISDLDLETEESED